MRAGQLMDMKMAQTLGIGRFLKKRKLVFLASGRVPAFTKRDGLWTNYDAVESLRLKGFQVQVFADNEVYDDSCDLYVFPKGLNHKLENKIGLIYTDGTFEKGVRALMGAKEYAGAKSISYTEQGMQGYNYVSMCGYSKAFVKGLKARFKDKFAAIEDWV